MDIEITPILPRKLGALDGFLLQTKLVAAMRDTVSEGVKYAQTYPPQVLTKTHYHRTHTLARSWSGEVRASGGGLIAGHVGSNANIAPYNVWVQGPAGQQRQMFAGAGWDGIDHLRIRMGARLGFRVDAALAEFFRKSPGFT